ncbi:hypothetical protein [Methylobacterium crusticola]|uniref:hypothetical protein n=1 Tax=Methylobacterium crusticola TaxID=1697972 RepID=UPI001396C8C1|nr:hypothetical protein [Methylobacterium crusticola]
MSAEHLAPKPRRNEVQTGAGPDLVALMPGSGALRAELLPMAQSDGLKADHARRIEQS